MTGEQRGADGVRVEATGTLIDTTTFGGRLPQMGFELTLDNDRLDVVAKGRVEDFELETLLAIPSAIGVLHGTVDARVSIPDIRAITVDRVGVEGTFTLDKPTLFDVPFDTIAADVSLVNGLATVRRLEGKGDGFTVTGDGVVGLGADDASDLRYRLEADSIVQPAKVADLPLTGAASSEGRVTGTRADFLVRGHGRG